MKNQKLTILHEVRCPNCRRLLGNLNGAYEIKCKKCKQILDGKTWDQLTMDS